MAYNSNAPTNPYASAHAFPQGLNDARPTAIQVVKDLDLVNKMQGKVILVTGSSSGIGIETVRALHLTGADVYMQVRDMEKGENVKADILASNNGLSEGRLELVRIDLDSLESVREGVREFLDREHDGGLNVLVNNAGKLRFFQ
jgi:NAD(P)-dependent dehydrogenase (short-subunit alcohol dehydrogenase family)